MVFTYKGSGAVLKGINFYNDTTYYMSMRSLTISAQHKEYLPDFKGD